MPLPEPKQDEERGDFIERCMADSGARQEFSDQGQRFAFCDTRWETHVKKGNTAPPQLVEAIAKADMPQPLYIARQVINADEIIEWAKAQGFKTTYPPEKMHVTVAYSKAPVDWFGLPDHLRTVHIPAGGPRDLHLMGPEKNVVALRFKSEALARRHQQVLEHGASWDWPEYLPHITITLDAQGVDIEEIEAYSGKIILGVEKFGRVKANWSEDIVEKIELRGTIAKVEKERRIAYGWATVIEKGGKPVIDRTRHRDVIPEETLIDAVHDYMLNKRAGGVMHEDGRKVGDVVESLIFTKDMQKALGIDLGMVGWWVGIRYTDDQVWKDIKSGKYKMFSIGGRGVRKPISPA